MRITWRPCLCRSRSSALSSYTLRPATYRESSTKGIVISFVAGIAAGVIGSRLYESHKSQIQSGLGSLRNRFAANGLVEDGDSAAEDDSVTLEELEKQKEHIEDLIADQQAKAGASGSAAS